MSILIKGMEMPTDCNTCPMLEGDRLDGLCHAASRWLDDDEYWRWYLYPEGDVDDSKPLNCPLVEVPTPHGRLIDADELHKAMYHRAFETDGDTMWQSGCWVRYRAIEQVQDSQPTIIEAEEGEEA